MNQVAYMIECHDDHYKSPGNIDTLNSFHFVFLSAVPAITKAIPLNARAEKVLITSFPLSAKGWDIVRGICRNISQIRIIKPSKAAAGFNPIFIIMATPEAISERPVRYVQKI